MSDDRDPKDDKRRRVIRTALVLAGVVLLIYVGFITRGILNAA